MIKSYTKNMGDFMSDIKFKKIFELSPDPILIIKDNIFIDCNNAAVSIMKCETKEQLLQINPSSISPKVQPDGRNSSERGQELFEEVDTFGVAQFEWVHLKSDGSELFVEVTLTRIELENEKLLYVEWKNLNDKRELELQLKETRKRFIEMANTSTDWIWEIDINGVYTFVSPRVKDFLGYSDKEIIGKTPFDTMRKKEASRVNKIFINYILKHLPFKDLENVNIHKDGHEVVLQTSGVPIFDTDGNFSGYRGTDREISDIKNLLKHLEESKENLKEAQKLSNIGHWELDLVHNSLYWSDEVYRIFGLEPQEFDATYESFLNHIHPDDHDLVNNAYSNSLADKSSYNIEHRVLTKQGKLKYVEERCIHKYDEDGNAVKSIGTVHDITQRVENDKELQLASNVFKYSTDAIVITDSNNKILSVNEAYEELTQYSLGEVLGKDPKVISSGWGDKKFYKKMWNDISEKGLWYGEIWDRKKSGDVYAAYQSIISVTDKDNKVINYIAISHDITEAKSKENTIHELAYCDFLTKLPNRKLFEQEVEAYIKSSHYSNKKFAILFLDLDNFKWVNDSLGHRFGDQVLVEMSKKLHSLIPEDSIVARLGGDEFVILAPYKNSLNISQLATKIIQSVKDHIVIDEKEINVGWSIGISLFPENACTYTLLLQNADTAMYEAKAKGKNNFQFFANEMNLFAQERLKIDTRLKHAVSNSLFTLNFQPKYSYSKNKTKGVEALIRWNDEELGFVPPDKFIPIAEESGYIYDIGLWVLKESIKALQVIHKVDNEITMAINVSGKQLESDKFYDDVIEIIQKTDVETSMLEFEITETSIMNDIESIIPILNKIKKLGIKISIDDFGTGYSSMAYLKKLPIDTLKIDREFVMHLEKDEEDLAIVEATIALSRAFKLSTVAEGVEKIEHKEILKKLGCDFFQGYYYSKPLDLDSLIEFIN